jgi:NADH-quinone oxidoreductase subunit A
LLVLAQSTSGPLWPLAVYAGSVVFMVAAMLAASWLLGERHRQRTTHEPYESGIPPTGSARLRLPAEFYPVAALFVIFDLEAVLFVAWAIAARPAGWAGFVEILIVAVVLLAALAYLWRQGALDWASTIRRQRRRGAEGEEKDEY